MKSILIATLTFLIIAPPAAAQSPDPQLLAEIQKIRAIDNHSHPPRVVGPNETDDEFDALPCDPLEPSDPPTTNRPENPQFLQAWKALWGYKYNDKSAAHIRELLATKQQIRAREGDNYPNWVLDHLGIESELANRIALGRGLTPPHFRWVPFDDALLFPLNNDQLASASPDRKFFFSREENLLLRYSNDLGVSAMPNTLAEYLEKVVTPELEKQKQQGAVAIKFEAAYLRSLQFEPANRDDAAAIYAKYIHAEMPPMGDYTHLQDFLLRYIAADAGRLNLPVHFHTGAGCGTYFNLYGSEPVRLESLFNDASLRKTKFVMLHGGSGPYTREIGALLMKPNVYADFSEQTWMTSTRALSAVIRDWLECYPEKVLFGTDLFPGKNEYDWEEIGYQTTQSAREALAIALTGMLADGEINRARALQLAHMILHDNAAKLYSNP
jgi:uncharacterized protein